MNYTDAQERARTTNCLIGRTAWKTQHPEWMGIIHTNEFEISSAVIKEIEQSEQEYFSDPEGPQELEGTELTGFLKNIRTSTSNLAKIGRIADAHSNQLQLSESRNDIKVLETWSTVALTPNGIVLAPYIVSNADKTATDWQEVAIP